MVDGGIPAMNSKLRLLLPFAAFAAALLVSMSGCATTAGGIAIAAGEKATGDVYANAKLASIDPSTNGTAAQTAAIADLARVGADLKAFAAGSLSPYELGNVEAQLKKDGLALSSNTAAVNQITSILNIFAQSVTGVNGLVLPAQAQVQASIANIVAGVNVAIQNYEGQWNVTNPGVWPAPAAAAPSS